jgi:hypothetical protein
VLKRRPGYYFWKIAVTVELLGVLSASSATSIMTEFGFDSTSRRRTLRLAVSFDQLRADLGAGLENR